ncbi:hypothetical protein ACFC4S_34375 [Priestia megaterium]|uniref:hypothetical protein n=1 Tax=Priestia megaterium TaxID=1404 RepID=UPI0035DCEF59
MSKNLMGKYLLLLLLVLVVSVLSAPLTNHFLNDYLPKGQDDWIGFSGNIVGGILGGICTLLGVAYAFSLEKNKAFKETIPNKIVNLYSLKQEINSHRLSKDYSSAPNWQKTVENMQLFLDRIEEFYNSNQEFLEKASQVDSDTFAAVERYYYGIKTIKLKTTAIINESGISAEVLQKEISEATKFQLNLLEIMIGIFEERQDYYLEYLHNQKTPKHVIEKFNNHDYIRSILSENNEDSSDS